MENSWSRASLRDAGVILVDCDHATPPAAEVGYPYVAIPQLRDGHINFSSARRISQEHLIQWTRKAKPQAHDVVLSRRTNPGVTAYVTGDVEFALGQNLVLLRADGSKVFPPFLRWLVRGPEWWKQIEKFINVGAVFDSLRCADVPNFELLIPPLPEQRAIARVLGALDKKIELNRRMAETLEAMTRALFKSWFVDFDPVRAKAEDRPTGLPDELAAAFPSSLGDDGIPLGWVHAPAGTLFDISGGNTPSTKFEEYWNGAHEWATPKDLSNLSSPVLIRTERRLSDAGLALSNSGLLPVGSLLLSSRAPIGYMAFATHPTAINQGFAGFKRREISTTYAWCWCIFNMSLLKAIAGGSTFPEISKAVLREAPMLRPDRAIVDEFARIADSLVARVIALAVENRTLEETRDTLLPRLLSGELRIRDAESTIEAA